jgi:hypothetical protein
VRGALIAALVVALGGCRPSRNAHDELRDLEAPDRAVRREAAEHIADSADCDPLLGDEVIGALVARVRIETDEDVRRDILSALVETGDPRVKELLDDYALTGDYANVRPSLMLRLSYLRFARFTASRGTLDALGFGAHFGLAADLWRSEWDHAVYLAASVGVDGLDTYALPGGALGLGGRY